MSDSIDRIRAFNRSYTSQMGLLARNYLSSDLTLTEVRVLYELCEEGPATLRDLAIRLDVDEGYLSRIIDDFSAKGWVEKRVHPRDGRRRIATPTKQGKDAFAPLLERSRAEIAGRLGKADPDLVADKIAALEQALKGVDPSKVKLRDLGIGDSGWLVQRHGELYARDEGFDATFEALVAEILAEFIRKRSPHSERAWIAECDGQRLGSVFCVKSDTPGVAKLRLFLVEPAARGTGLGRHLLEECIAFARSKGNHTLRLWTHESHRAACALYEKYGFVCTRSEPVTSFGVDLIEQTWELDLT